MPTIISHAAVPPWPARRAMWGFGLPFTRSAAFLFVAMASHGILDMFTNGGLGVALLWPASETRLFAPWRPIEVWAIGVSRFFSSDFMTVLASEAPWLWLPCILLALALRRLVPAP